MSALHSLAVFVFWTSVCLVCYTYLFYPIILFCIYSLVQVRRDFLYLTRRTNRRIRVMDEGDLPRVSVIIPAYNEERHLPAALQNLMAVDYPPDKVEILVISDGSTDCTNDIIRNVQDPRVRTIINTQRSGKASTLNDGARMAAHEILVFADASTQLSRDAIRTLVRQFAHTRVGVVCGALTFLRSAESQQTEGLYWKYESMMRLMEGRLGATLTASGALYAIRRECYIPIEKTAILDDLLIPMRARRAGYSVVYEPDATASEFDAGSVSGEATRRTRLAMGSFRALPELLRTPMAPITLFAFVSHKLLRWILPLLFMLAFVSNLVLCTSKFYRLLLVIQVAFYVWGVVGLMFRRYMQRVPYALIGYFLLAMNIAFVKGFIMAMLTRKEGTWERAV